MKQCPNCGKQNNDDALFCNGCGTPLDNILETQQPMASIPPAAPVPPPPSGATVPPAPPTPPAGQPIHPATPPQPQQPVNKKSSTGKVIAIAAGVIIFLAAAASLFYWWVMKSDTPTYEDPVTVCDSAVADSTTADVEVADSMAMAAPVAIDEDAPAAEEAAAPVAAGDELASSSFPNVKHGSDQAFEKYVSSLDRNGVAYARRSGSGILDGSPYSVEFVIIPGERLTGRYHNEYNGLNLDLNGYYSDGGVLHFKLGHKNETSYMILRPTRGRNSYTGYWGKSKKPSTLTLD